MEVRDRAEDVRRVGAAVLVICFSPVEAIPALRADLEFQFDVAADPEQSVYRAYGLDRASVWRTWHPLVLLRYAALLLRGMAPVRPDSGVDLSQLGGDFVVDRNGRIAHAFRSTLASERPTVDTLLDAVRSSSSPAHR